MMYVKMEKLEQISNINSLSVGYWIKGILLSQIEVGARILVQRYIRNGAEMMGITNTTIVQKIISEEINNLLVHTENSVYRIEFLNEEEFLEKNEKSETLTTTAEC